MGTALSAIERLNERDAREWLRLARRGDFAGAWHLSDAIRRRCPEFGDPRQPRHLQQIWNGQAFDGRDVLVRCYHGLGDTIQFVRFVAPLQRVARRVTLWAQPSLVPLLRTLRPAVAIEALHDGSPAASYDVDIEVMELAYAARITMSTVPSTVPYLHVSPLPWTASDSLRVGLVWRAGNWDPKRSIAFEHLEPLFDVRGVQWFGLQADPRVHEQHPSLQPLDVSTPLGLAVSMRTLDLVISVDTLSAHLAGALGVKVWLLLPRDADWRWLEHRSDSPWYPTMRIFRQRRAGCWSTVLAGVVQAISRP